MATNAYNPKIFLRKYYTIFDDQKLLKFFPSILSMHMICNKIIAIVFDMLYYVERGEENGKK